MGLTRVMVRIKKDKTSAHFVDEEFLVDSGAAYTIAPASLLAQIGVEPDEERMFRLANGDRIARRIGEACFEYAGRVRSSPVIFGQPGDQMLLGVVTLEVLELALDPVNRELKPLPMLLM